MNDNEHLRGQLVVLAASIAHLTVNGGPRFLKTLKKARKKHLRTLTTGEDIQDFDKGVAQMVKAIADCAEHLDSKKVSDTLNYGFDEKQEGL